MEGCFEGCFQGGGGDVPNGVEGPAGDGGFFTFRLARRGLVFRVLGTRGVGLAMAIAAMLQSGMAARARAVQGAVRLRAAGALAKGGAAAKTKKVRTDGEFLQFCRLIFKFFFRSFEFQVLQCRCCFGSVCLSVCPRF